MGKTLVPKETLKYKNAATIISIALLLIAILPISNYGYYTFLRVIIFVCAGFLACLAHDLRKNFWFSSMMIIAILFNPIIPIYLHNKEIWSVINFIVAVFFATSIFQIKAKSSEKSKLK